MDLVVTQQYGEDLAASVTDTDGVLDGVVVGLFTNDVQPVLNSDATQFDVPTFAGYATEAVTWLAPSISDDGEIEVIGTVGEFRPTNAVTPNTVFGATILQSGALMMAGRFDGAPLPMESALDSINLTLRYRPLSQSLAIVIS